MTPARHRILIVDDEPDIRAIYQSVLAAPPEDQAMRALEAELFGSAPVDEGPRYNLVCCDQAEGAVEAHRVALEQGEPFSVVFLDMRMPPGRDGLWAAEQIRAADPLVQIIVVTGYSDTDAEDIARRVPPRDKLLYVRKPLHTQELKRFASALSARWEADRQLA